MRILLFILLCVLGGGLYFGYDRLPQIKNTLIKSLPSSKVKMVQIRYSAETLMEKNQKELLKQKESLFLTPELHLYPYLLMEVKYAAEGFLPKEGVLIWGLKDGEMVLNGGLWETSHGYEDCLNAPAKMEDFKIVHALYEAKGSLEKERLQERLFVERQKMAKWIASCQKKKLIYMAGNKVHLHFKEPKFALAPFTQWEERLMHYPVKKTVKESGLYSSSQLQKMAETAWGEGLCIRKAEEIYLPVYHLKVQNPDGSILEVAYNASTGQIF